VTDGVRSVRDDPQLWRGDEVDQSGGGVDPGEVGKGVRVDSGVDAGIARIGLTAVAGWLVGSQPAATGEQYQRQHPEHAEMVPDQRPDRTGDDPGPAAGASGPKLSSLFG